ncbi:hypothetical protein MTO96_031059 [Rhipicephalus appendiculatus]
MSNKDSHDVLSTNQWKRHFDLERPCGAVSSDYTCWLCEDFTAWDPAMYALDLELVETAPGTMRLTFSPNTGKEDLVTAAREASSVISSLLRHHACIQELNLECAISTNTSAAQPSFPVFMRPESSNPKPPGAHIDLRDIDAINGLETLYIDIGRFSQCFAAEIDALLERNRNTLKCVGISEARPGLNKLRMVEHLAACKVLTLESSEFIDTTTPNVAGMVSLLHSSTTLKEATVNPIDVRQFRLIAKALETNRCLTKLSLYVRTRDSIEELFGALELNQNLKELSVLSRMYVNMTCARAVAAALKKNSSLQTLHMETVILQDGVGLGLWSEALSKNVTLHVFRMKCGEIPMSEVSALCKALQVNKSLKELKLKELRGSDEERTALALQLCEDDCFDRVHFGPWREPYARVLLPVLASSPVGINELWLLDICRLSRESIIFLFCALDSNKIKHLTVHVGREPNDTVAPLCDTLKKNRFLESLCINIRNSDSANEILRALALNTAIIKLDITLELVATEETTTAFSGMLSHNRAITNIRAHFEADDPGPFMEAFAQGLSRNRLIVRYSVSPAVCCPPGLRGSFHRNRAALNRAMDFVLGRRVDRLCAECFEQFFGRSCLVSRLVQIADLSDVEARLSVIAAEKRRRETYLILTSVIRHSVVCWPADVTQIDALNGDCWCAIARYLKVTDVCSQ